MNNDQRLCDELKAEKRAEVGRECADEQRLDDDIEYCEACDGSGESMSADSTCQACKGSGVVTC